MPWSTIQPARGEPRMNLGGVSGEEWLDRGAGLTEQLRLEGLLPPVGDEREWEPEDMGRYYFRLAAIIGQVSGRYMQRKGRRGKMSPPETFLTRHVGYPDMDGLLAALENNLPHVVERLTNRISADGWRAFLATVGRSNARALYEYLAQDTGASNWEGAAEDLAPILVGATYVVGGIEKSVALARYFARKLSVEEQPGPAWAGMMKNPDFCPLPSFRERIQTEIRLVRRLR